MKRSFGKFFAALFVLSSVPASAETALVCGDDLDLVERDNSQAAVHLITNRSPLVDMSDVNHLLVGGVREDVVSASTENLVVNGQSLQLILVSTKNESFLFADPEKYGCSREGALRVSIKSTRKQFKCRCFEG